MTRNPQANQANQHPIIAETKTALLLEVCIGPSCTKFYPETLFQAFKKQANGCKGVRVVKTGCTGNCDFSPNIKINGQVRRQIALEEVDAIFSTAIKECDLKKGDQIC